MEVVDQLAGAGAIAEFLHYNISLTPEQRQKIEGYLSWKWGLQNSLPTYHPYYKFAPAATIPYIFSMNTFTAANFNLNGAATLTTSTLQLTPIGNSLSSSAFYVNKVKITNFTTYFHMTFTNTNADGSTFCIQNYACNAVSGGGGSLGYNPTMPTSVAITLKTYASSAFAGNTGILSTDLLTNGLRLLLLASVEILIQLCLLRRIQPGISEQLFHMMELRFHGRL
jgi:hypothetical protein